MKTLLRVFAVISSCALMLSPAPVLATTAALNCASAQGCTIDCGLVADSCALIGCAAGDCPASGSWTCNYIRSTCKNIT